MRGLIFLVGFSLVVSSKGQSNYVLRKDEVTCEREIEKMRYFCPKHSKCLSKTEDVMTCVIAELKDVSSSVKKENETNKMDNKIKELNSSLSSRIAELEKGIVSLKSLMESKKTDSSGSPASSDFQEEQTANMTSFDDSPCLYVWTDASYIVTPHLGYAEAKHCCYENNAVPLVPKSQADYIDLVIWTTVGIRFGWLPLNDLKEIGVPVWEDGTSLEDGPFKPKFTTKSPYSMFGPEKRCSGVSSIGVAYWFPCNTLIKMLCVKKSSVKQLQE